jgi:hypothetical protein
MGAAVLPLAFVVLPAAIVLAAAFGLPRLIEARRQKAYANFCIARGYQYVPQRKDATVPYEDVVGMFKGGTSHAWRDEISGQLNFRPFTAFEYQYVTGAGRSRMVFNRAMIHWQLDGTPLPRFTLVPASTYLFRIGRDPKGIDFPEDTAFSKAYVLTGEDQAAIRGVFTPELRASMTAMKGQFVAAQAADVFWWQEGRLPAADGFDEFLNEGTRVLQLFAHV